jgi:hypothetical protein
MLLYRAIAQAIPTAGVCSEEAGLPHSEYLPPLGIGHGRLKMPYNALVVEMTRSAVPLETMTSRRKSIAAASPAELSWKIAGYWSLVVPDRAASHFSRQAFPAHADYCQVANGMNQFLSGTRNGGLVPRCLGVACCRYLLRQAEPSRIGRGNLVGASTPPEGASLLN